MDNNQGQRLNSSAGSDSSAVFGHSDAPTSTDPQQHEASTDQQDPLSESQSPFDEITTSALNSNIDHHLPTTSEYIEIGSEETPASAPSQIDLMDPPVPDNEQDPNSSIPLIHFGSSTGRSFATPLKLLPPLKDIEHIVTPKSFGVAKDDSQGKATVISSPVTESNNVTVLREIDEDPEDTFDVAANDTFAKPSHQTSGPTDLQSSNLEAAALFLGIDPSVAAQFGENVVSQLAERAHNFHRIQSELSFFKLNQEHVNQVHTSKYEAFQKKINNLSHLNETLSNENETLLEKVDQKEATISQLKTQTSSLSEKLQEVQNSAKSIQISQSLAVTLHSQEIARLNDAIHKLTESNVKLSQLLNQLTKELNDETNEKFQYKLELTKASSELTYSKKQRDWYSNQLKAVQEKYTELIKRHETDFLKMSNQISTLSSQNESFASTKTYLESQIRELETKLESESAKLVDLESKTETQKIKYAKESVANEEMIELVKMQLQEREKRITQLESYAEELKTSASNSIAELQSALSDKDEKLTLLEVKLKRTEEAFGAELQRETDLPKISSSAETILNESNLGISLSALYTEFNLVKKELILEKSQKEKLATQLQHFVTELESKKPAIANYRNQVQFYELSMRDSLEKLETLRMEKMEVDKNCSRLRACVADYETEKQSLKQLLKDLGRQLCFYLIHSNIREGQDDPLTGVERRAIDQILAKSGANDQLGETDTDILITERLVTFSSIIELQKKNEELLVSVRKLGRELESKDSESNGLEATAIEEAKDAILTLQSELDSVNIKLEAVTKERDLLKSLGHNNGNGDSRSADVKILTQTTVELKGRVKELEQSLRALQDESSEKIRNLTKKLLDESSSNEQLKLQAATSKHSMDLAESRLSNTKQLLENAQKIVEHTRSEVDFWKKQASKQEELLVKKSNDLRDEERRLFEYQNSLHSLQVDKELLSVTQNSLRNEVEQLKEDKKHLTSFVSNLQALLEEREASASDLSSKLSQSLVNYQALQERINEKEERIQVLSSQSELSLKAQNSKLEQVSELSQKLLEIKSKLAEKQILTEKLRAELEERNRAISSSRASYSSEKPSAPAFDTTSSTVPTLEFEHIKDRLRDAELQVQEFATIARASEEALESASRSYEEYKATSADTLRLLEHDKEELTSEVAAKEAELIHLRDEMKALEERLRGEVMQLQAQVQESKYKSSSYDEMKADLEKKIEVINSDLQNQTALFNDLAQRHDAKSSELENLNLQLAQQKDEVEKLKQETAAAKAELLSVRNQVESSELELKEKYAGQEEALLAARGKIADLEFQYNIALNQIELKSNLTGTDGDDTTEDLRQVVRFLRHEKDATEAKNVQLSNDIQHFKTQIDSITLELNATTAQLSRLQAKKAKVNESVEEHSRLMEQLEQLNILRESNVTLRNESNELKLQIKQYELSIKALEEKLTSASNGDETSSALQSQELNLLKEENGRLKTQLANNEEYKTLMQRFENLKAEFRAKLLGHRNKSKELEKQLVELKATHESVDKELLQLKAKLSNDESQNLKAQLTKLTAEKDIALRKLQTELAAAKTDYESRLAQAKASGDDETEKKNLEADYKLKIAAFKEEHEQKLLSLQKEHDLKIAALKEEFDKKMEKEKKSIQESAEKKCDFKLRVLNRKLERLEKEKVALTGQHEEGPQPTDTTNINNKRVMTPETQADVLKKLKE